MVSLPGAVFLPGSLARTPRGGGLAEVAETPCLLALAAVQSLFSAFRRCVVFGRQVLCCFHGLLGRELPAAEDDVIDALPALLAACMRHASRYHHRRILLPYR